MVTAYDRAQKGNIYDGRTGRLLRRIDDDDDDQVIRDGESIRVPLYLTDAPADAQALMAKHREMMLAPRMVFDHRRRTWVPEQDMQRTSLSDAASAARDAAWAEYDREMCDAWRDPCGGEKSRVPTGDAAEVQIPARFAGPGGLSDEELEAMRAQAYADRDSDLANAWRGLGQATAASAREANLPWKRAPGLPI